MQIRHPTSSDEVQAIATVMATAFEITTSLDSLRQRYALLEQVLGRDVFLALEVEGRFVSSLVCIPSTVWVGTRRLTLGAVSDVSTLPEYRRRGYAGRLLQAAVQQMQARGLATSALWPFSFPYYRKFGWDFAQEQRTYRVRADKLGPLPDPKGVSPVSEESLTEVMDVFETYAHTLAFCTDRDEAWWRQLLRLLGVVPFAPAEKESKRMIVCRDDGGRLVGYAIYRPPRGEERQVNVGEMVALTPEARLRLLSALIQEGAGEVRLEAPVNDCFPAQIGDPRQVEVTLEPGFAFRVIDPVAALEVLPVAPSLKGSLHFTLQDPARPESPLEVAAEAVQGEVVARRVRRAPGAGLYLATDISTFSQMFSGYLSPAQAHWLGRVQADEATLDFATRLFPRWVAFRSGLEPG